MMLPLQASYDRGYATAAQECAIRHGGFVQSLTLWCYSVCRAALDEVNAKFPAGMAANTARLQGMFASIEATAAETPLVSSEAIAAETPLVSSEAIAAALPSFFSSEAIAHLPFTIGEVVA